MVGKRGHKETRAASEGGHSRRSLLKYAAVSTVTASLAGCSGQGGGGEGEGEGEGTTAGGTEAGGESTEGTSSGSGGGQEVVVAQPVPAQTLDPQDFRGSFARQVVLAPYEKLITFDYLGDGSLVPQLASDWSRPEPERVRIQLREGVTWHNGDEFLPEDAAFTINRVSNPDVDITTRRTLQNVDSAEVVAGENAIDVHLTAADPIIVHRIASSGGVVQKSWVEENEQEYVANNANGTGPYTPVEFSPASHATFEMVDDYWDGDVDLDQYPDRLTYQASGEASTRINQLLAEEAHIIPAVNPAERPRINDTGFAEAIPALTNRTMWLLMRQDLEPYSSIEFRKGLNHAVDKQTLVETVLEGIGQPVHQVTPQSWTGAHPTLNEDPMYPYDPERAAELIEQSGHAGVEITLNYNTGRYLKGPEVAQALVGMLDSIENISCTGEGWENSAYRDRIYPGTLEDKLPLTFWGSGSSPPDAATRIDRGFVSDSLDDDFAVFHDPEIDELSAQAANTTDSQQREQYLQEANRLIMEKAACVPLYQQGALYGVNTDVVEFEPIPNEEIYWFSMNMV